MPTPSIRPSHTFQWAIAKEVLEEKGIATMFVFCALFTFGGVLLSFVFGAVLCQVYPMRYNSRKSVRLTLSVNINSGTGVFAHKTLSRPRKETSKAIINIINSFPSIVVACPIRIRYGFL